MGVTGKHGAFPYAWAIAWVLALSFPASAASGGEGKQDPAIADPVQLLETLLSDNTSIRQEDKDALRRILSAEIASPDALVPFAEFSQARKELLAEKIRRTIGNFPTDPFFDTPLQREYNVRNFRLGILRILNTPVFAPTGSAAVREQISQVVAIVSAAARNLYPDIDGTAVPKHLEEFVSSRLTHDAGDDTTPAMKYPLSDADFASALERVKAECAKAPALGLFHGHLLPDWEKMDAAARVEQMKAESHRIVSFINMSFSKAISSFKNASAQAALKDQYSSVDLYQLPPPVIAEEVKEVSDLAQKVFAEMTDLQKKWMEMQAVKREKEAAEARFRINFGDTAKVASGIAMELTSTDSLPPINEEAPSTTTRNSAPTAANDAVTEKNAVPVEKTGTAIPPYAIVAVIAALGMAVLTVIILIRKRRRGI